MSETHFKNLLLVTYHRPIYLFITHYFRPVLKVVSKRWGAELAMDDRVAGGHEGVGSGEGVSPFPVGVGPGEGAREFCPWEWCILVQFLCYFLQSTGIIIIIQNTVKQEFVRPILFVYCC